MANFLERATNLVSRGFSVIPLTERGKSPIAVGATGRSRDINILNAWAQAYPQGNVGICADENITILESDDASRLREILAAQGVQIPETLTGGASENRPHWFYKRTPSCGNNCITVPGLFEFRNSNQYVVGPGSIHPSGVPYRFWNDASIVPISDELVATLRELADDYAGDGKTEHIQPGPYAKLRHAYLQRMNPDDLLTLELDISEGERHYTLMSLAGLLHDGERTAEDIAEILMRVQETYFAEHKGDTEVSNIANYAVRREPCSFEPRELETFAVGTRVFKDQASLDAWILANQDKFSVEWDCFATKEMPPQRVFMTLEGQPFLREEMVSEVFAYRGLGKSALVAAMIKCLTKGEQFLGFASSGNYKVLLVDGELPERLLQQRLKSLVGPGTKGNFRVRSLAQVPEGYMAPLAGRDQQKEFLAQLNAWTPDVIIFDTKTAIFKHDTNAQDQLLAVNEFLIRLRSLGRTVLTVHHAGKNGTQRGRTDNDDIADLIVKLSARRDWAPGMGLEFSLDFEKVRYGDKLEGFDAAWDPKEGWHRLENVDKEIVGLLLKGDSINKVAKALGIGNERVSTAKRRAIANGVQFPGAGTQKKTPRR
jgi:hypothetical protein